MFLFIFWKRLKEDYASEIVFKTGINILLGMFIGFLLSIRFLQEWFFYLEMFGALAGLLLSFFKLKVHFFESLEAATIGFTPWLLAFFLSDSVINSSLTSFFSFLVILIFIFLFYFLEGNYKRFSWYKSGRVGFVGLASLALFFLVRSMVATLGSTVLSFVGRYEGIVAATVGFFCFLMIYNLGRK